MTVIPAACACLLLMSLCVWGQDCPPPDSNCQDFESDSDEVQKGYSAISAQAESTLNGLDQAISSGFADEQNCPIADNLTDFSDRSVARNTRDTLPIQIAPVYGRSCEPCPPRVHYLHRFYRRCYVIFPFRQWVRYVTCPSKCNEPCWCSNTRCVPTRYIRVWLWAWCVGSDLPWGYRFGLNWRWLWLPQDCQCRELDFFG